MHACEISAEHQWQDSLKSKIAQVQQAFKNIPQMLYFSPSSVICHGIGVYAAQALPKGNNTTTKTNCGNNNIMTFTALTCIIIIIIKTFFFDRVIGQCLIWTRPSLHNNKMCG